jgi:hypothetical protein
VFHDLYLNNAASCVLLFAHPELSHSLSNKGLPLLCCDLISQISINQLSDRWTPPCPTPDNAPKHPTFNVVIDGNVRNVITKVMKLTQGKLMKQDDWSE